jgi:hypothetical protein
VPLLVSLSPVGEEHSHVNAELQEWRTTIRKCDREELDDGGRSELLRRANDTNYSLPIIADLSEYTIYRQRELGISSHLPSAAFSRMSSVRLLGTGAMLLTVDIIGREE